MERLTASVLFGLCLIMTALTMFALSGCEGDPMKSGKPVNGIAPPEFPQGEPEASDRAQQSLVTAFGVAMGQGEGIEQMGMVHPALLAEWAGYGPYKACGIPLVAKLPNPTPEAVAEYSRYRNWGGKSFGNIRAWAILDQPCGKETAWKRSAVWIVQATGGWRVIRYETDGAWYTGP